MSCRSLPRLAGLVLGALIMMAVPALADALKDEIAPTGKLRVAIAISPAGGAFWSTRNEAGGYAGVPVDLGKAMAARLGIPVEYVTHNNSGQIVDAVWRNRDVLNPFRKGFYAIQLLSHKVMRYLVPLFLIAVFITSALLAWGSLFFAAIFIAQVMFYLAAGASALMVRVGINSRLLALPQYFVITNVACLLALIKLMRGERYVRWEPVRERVNA